MVEKQEKDITNGKSGSPEDMVSQIGQTVKNFHNQLSDELNLLKAEFDKLVPINQQLELDLEHYKQKNEQLAQENNEIQAESKKQYELLIKELSDIEKQTENEINSLLNQIKAADKESQGLHEDLSSAQKSVKALESENAESIQQKEILLSEKEEISDQLTELDQKHSKLDNKHKAYIKRKTAAGNKLRDENKILKEDLKTVKGQQNQLKNELSQEKVKYEVLLNESEILKSEKYQLLIESENFDKRIQNEQEQSLFDIVTQLSEHLSKLSVLSGEEPQEVRGLKIETVYRDLLDWMANIIGERPRSFPASKDCDEDGTLWLDADKEDLKILLEKYDWSNIRPFENLPEGERLLPFRVMRRGWQVRETVLKQGKIKLIDID